MTLEGGVPDTRFATLGDDRIAYQVFGEGDVDLLYAGATGDPIELRWDWLPYAAYLRRLADRARVVTFDRRGSGSSDEASGEALPGWERWADDALAVLDAVGSERAVVCGLADGGPFSVLFAATHASRTRGLILVNTAASFVPDAGAVSVPDVDADFVVNAWGTPALAEFTMPDSARDPAFVRWLTRSNRLAYSPRAWRTVMQWEHTMDVREALGSVRVPTLVIHRKDYGAIALEQGRYLSEHIAGARLAVVPGRDGMLYSEPSEDALREVERFLDTLGAAAVVLPDSDRALAAILFTDIVRSTERVAAIGDHAWRNLLESHDAVARTVVEQHRGRLVKSTGDGILATFDGPGRAIRAALLLRDALAPLGIEICAGLHTGEVELRGDDIAGIGVHIASRVLGAAGPGELMVSAAVPMLVAGSGVEFADRGEHELKGVPGVWQLYVVASAAG